MKHSADSCLGVFLGTVTEGKDQTVTFKRAVPLFHTHSLNPSLKFALLAAEALGKREGLQILGLYTANSCGSTELTPAHSTVHG